MKIEVVSKSADLSLSGKAEVWVHVFANEVHDWPRILDKLNATQKAMLDDLGRRTLAYYPHTPTTGEREEHGYIVDDYWVWSGK